ncbi:hypothetical protein [Rhodococcus koreensis]|uniref:hypothetical protein n=1 Tax=Rhodococcus koreensis TaxID=99653 RepID=UPI0036DAD110
MCGQDYIDVILGAGTEMGGEPGRIIVTPTADRDLHVSLEFGPIDDTARKAPDPWPRRITITHQSGAADRRRWTHHVCSALADRCNYGAAPVLG